jgi:ABC-type amino acid transport substrate-binding protein
MQRRTQLLASGALALLLAAPAFGAATLVVVNTDAPGTGFNDPTAATPVGGNTGTTVGEQRLIAFQYAADFWGNILDSTVPIYVQASFASLPCDANGGILGSTAPIQIFANFPHAKLRNTWYHVALANKMAGADLVPGPTNSDADDIVAFFNGDLGTANCIPSENWYYGLDDNHGNDIDLVTVLLHEMSHGLGFSAFFNAATGEQLEGHPDVYESFMLDTGNNKLFTKMTNGQRAAASVDTNRMVWTGAAVTAAVPHVLHGGTPEVTVTKPAALGVLRVGTALFGPPLSARGVHGNVAIGFDADEDGPGGASTTTDGCSAITTNLRGKIALIDRGVCAFTVKVKNAQDAGAIGVIIVDNVAGSPPAGMSGTDATITIPSVRVSQADGTKLRASLAHGATAQATIGVNTKVLSGADAKHRMLLYAPNPLQQGSSVSHWDTIANPNLLMEPAINQDLTHNVDLTKQLFQDEGWFAPAGHKVLDGGDDDDSGENP